MGAERLCVIRWPEPGGDPPDVAAAHRAFEPCVRVVADMVPLVEVGAPGQLCFATRGPSRYFGGDAALADELLARLAGLTGTRPGLGIAEGRLAATVAALRSAHRGAPVLVTPGEAPAFLAPLPVRVLVELAGVPEDLVGRLDRLGLRRLGDVAALPAGDLLARFGPEGARARHLAGGGDGEPVVPGVPARPDEVAAHLDEPLPQLEAVVFVARRLADELVTRLAGDGRVCTLLRVEVETEHGERSERCWAHADGLSAPAVVERVRWQMEGWVGGGVGDTEITAGVVLVRLAADEVRADRGRQVALWGGQRHADDAAVRAIARVSGLLGPEGVQVPEWRGGRDPWQQYQLVPAAAVDPDERPARVRPEPRPWPGSLPAPAPARVLAEPVGVELFDDAGRSVQVSGRGELSAPPVTLRVHGRTRHLVAWAGPWPVEERWWDPRRHRRRARLQLVTDDGEALLVAVEQGRWWLRAVYA